MRRRIVAAALALLLAACGGASTDPVAASGRQSLTVTYTGDDCVYEGPDGLVEGPLDITFVNDTHSSIGLDVRRLRDGVTYDEFIAGVQVGEPAPHHLARPIEWLSRDHRGLSNMGELSSTVFVTAKEHTLLCAIEGPHGEPVDFIHVGSIPVTATS